MNMAPTAWTPPDDPDPSGILQSAVDNTRKGLYSQALTKHLWYHHNALKFCRGQGGVRHSFALSYWLELAEAYPPAMDAFVFIRDETEIAFLKSPDFELFHDLASLNERLGDELRTANLFAEVAEEDHEMACQIYHVAEHQLIALGRYRECGPFLELDERLGMAVECYRVSKEFDESLSEQEAPDFNFARQGYVDELATLVALLVLNDREDDAESACKAALEVVDDADFRTTLDAAMTGHFPDKKSF